MKKRGTLSTWIMLTGAWIVALAGCSSTDKPAAHPPTPFTVPAEGQAPSPKVEIIIGNLSDLTGVSATALSTVNRALEDAVRHYNIHDLIPQAQLKIITFDSQFDAAQDIPGYEWLKQRGADLIFTPMPATAAGIRHRVEADGRVLFSLAPSEKALTPPGRVFCVGGTFGKFMSYTFLDWIATSDPDFPQGRPARIGGAFWAEEYGQQILEGAEAYARAHPDRYQWEGGYLVPPLTWTWGAQVEALRHCDYVFAPVPMHTFVREFKNAGYPAKFIGTDAHLAFLRLIGEANLWPQVDGMLIINPPEWWNEEGETVNWVREILAENRSPKEAKEIIEAGNGYLAAAPIRVMLEIIAAAVKTAGPQGFDSESLYNAAEAFSMTEQGMVCYSFTQTKRTAVNCLGIYELSGETRDLVRKDPALLPVITTPSGE